MVQLDMSDWRPVLLLIEPDIFLRAKLSSDFDPLGLHPISAIRLAKIAMPHIEMVNLSGFKMVSNLVF